MAMGQTGAARGQVSHRQCAVHSIPAWSACYAAVVAAVVQGPVSNRHFRRYADLVVALFALGSSPGRASACCYAVDLSAAQASASFSSEWITPFAADRGAPRFVAAQSIWPDRKRQEEWDQMSHRDQDKKYHATSLLLT